MFTVPDVKLSSSNAALLSSTFLLIPVSIRCESKEAHLALRNVEEIVAFLAKDPAASTGGAELVGFSEVLPPEFARVKIKQKARVSSFSVTVAVRVALPEGAGFWERLACIYQSYERLSAFAAGYENAKDVEVVIEEAWLEHQRDDGNHPGYHLK